MSLNGILLYKTTPSWFITGIKVQNTCLQISPSVFNPLITLCPLLFLRGGGDGTSPKNDGMRSSPLPEYACHVLNPKMHGGGGRCTPPPTVVFALYSIFL